MTLRIDLGNYADLVGLLAGDWTISRIVSNGATLAGMATISTVESHAARYHEEGVLRLPEGMEILAYRDYLLEAGMNDLRMMFDEDPPRLFQAFTLSVSGNGIAGTSQHICDQDVYHSRFELISRSEFTLRHDVSGPRKSYRMVTHYRR